ncbi:unnamed protein product [Paramecium primaurelia]|uniref:Uncharacterized protein n=1 Tax=Paramecium primaurelia TaxID=5886 RepID=A0A8S1MQ55_PARPR|nr:unnamed protein product [Paramecium primaurelia]
MNQSLFLNNFINKQQICEYFGNVLLATDYSGQIVLILCNGEIITFQLIQQKQWLKTSQLRVIPQTEIIQLNDYNLQLNGNGRKFFLLQVDERYEFKVSIWKRGHKANWIFQQSLILYSHSDFLSITLNGNIVMVNHLKMIRLWEFNHTQTKLTRVQSLSLESNLACFNENNSVIAAKLQYRIVLLKRVNQMWIKYQNIKTEQVVFMQFFKNRLILMNKYLYMYKMDEQFQFQLEKKIQSNFFQNEPQFCLFMGSIIIAQLPSLELECHKYENNVWSQDEVYFTGKFEANQILQSKDYKKLFIYRKRYGGMVFEKKKEINEKIQQ